MSEIEIVFTSPKKVMLGAEALKLYMREDYCHVAIRFYSKKYDRTMVYHAAHGIVHFIENTNFEKSNNIVKSFKLKIEDTVMNDLIVGCIDIAGVKYAYAELPKIVFYDFCFYVLGIIPNIKDSVGFICSELIGKILVFIIKMPFPKPLHLLTPVDIVNYIEEHIDGQD